MRYALIVKESFDSRKEEQYHTIRSSLIGKFVYAGNAKFDVTDVLPVKEDDASSSAQPTTV